MVNITGILYITFIFRIILRIHLHHFGMNNATNKPLPYTPLHQPLVDATDECPVKVQEDTAGMR